MTDGREGVLHGDSPLFGKRIKKLSLFFLTKTYSAIANALESRVHAGEAAKFGFVEDLRRGEWAGCARSCHELIDFRDSNL